MQESNITQPHEAGIGCCEQPAKDAGLEAGSGGVPGQQAIRQHAQPSLEGCWWDVQQSGQRADHCSSLQAECEVKSTMAPARCMHCAVTAQSRAGKLGTLSAGSWRSRPNKPCNYIDDSKSRVQGLHMCTHGWHAW